MARIIAGSLKADFQNATIGSDEPSGFGSSEGYRPKSRHVRQREPGRAFVRSPGCASVIRGDHHGASEIVSAAATSLSNVTQSENSAGYRRRTRKSPSSAAIAGNRGARVIGITGIQIAPAHDSMVRIAEINGE